MSKLKDLTKRFVLSLLAIAVVVLIFFIAQVPYLQFLLLLPASFIGLVAVKEWVTLSKAKGKILSFPFLGCWIVGEIFSFFFATLYPSLTFLPWFWLFVALVAFALFNFKEIDNSMERISLSFFSLAYIAFPVGMALAILVDRHIEGAMWFFYLLTVTKINDIAAYFFGSLLGKKKIAPHISPNKTYVGTFAGILFSLLSSLAFYFYFHGKATGLSFSITFMEAVILGLVLGVGAVLGDLAESLFKRDADVKDSNVVPGLGGVLDLLDSLSWNIPLLYFYLV